MKIRVRVFGLIAASLGYKERFVEIPKGTTIKEVFNIIGISINPSWTMTSVNGMVKDKKALLRDGDELSILPVGGGG